MNESYWKVAAFWDVEERFKFQFRGFIFVQIRDTFCDDWFRKNQFHVIFDLILRESFWGIDNSHINCGEKNK